ncbi:hypothetical protein A0H81_10835 [Grifola frondosa]|uniref:Uncharacterized protein n=1 Tax=Grifola frondosa TaxID=5627 RepID=A0A1C7LYI6_GRIFR|nr:hypothetical protein A0H81_10835 [Grifola frondosa]
MPSSTSASTSASMDSLASVGDAIAYPDNTILVRPAPTLLEHNDFSAVTIWTGVDKKDFNQKSATSVTSSKSGHSNGTPKAYGFLQDSKGNPLSVERLEEMCTFAYMLFNELLSHGKAPDMWGQATAVANWYFESEMSIAFEEFQYYSNPPHWKAHAFVMLVYPTFAATI